MSHSLHPAPSRNPVLWGAYLACSWTWCIGMFLPIFLLRDMGWAGFWIFAVPNVIGAAAMGWIIKSRASSAEFVADHARAIWWFSAVTLAFHFYWILWIARFIQTALGIPDGYLTGSCGFIAVFALISGGMIRRGKAPQIALALLVLSLTVLIGTIGSPELNAAQSVLVASSSLSLDALWMLPIMLFGFLLCPYLDITFHHARQELDAQKNGRIGFTIGFVGFFSFMILLTTRYAGVFAGALNGSEVSPMANRWLAAGILVHMLCQWVFTVRVHFNRMLTLPGAERRKLLLVVLVLISGAVGVLAPRLPAYAGLSGGELIYRLFMSAYGLIFPAYMLYRVIADKVWKPAIWMAMALATPLFWMGFIERQPIWLLPGMALILLGAMLQRLKRPA